MTGAHLPGGVVRDPSQDLMVRCWRWSAYYSTHVRGWPRVLLWYLFLPVTLGLPVALYYGFYCAFEDDFGLKNVLKPSYVSFMQRHSYYALVYMVSSVLHTLFLFTAPLPKDQDAVEWVNDPKFAGKVGVLIPCHRSADEIGATCSSVIKHIPPGNVIVADNANQEAPPDDTRAVIEAVHKDINYIFIPVGHKTNALNEGLALLPPWVEYVLHLDDDTMLPEHFVLDPAKFADPQVSAISYGIEMIKTNACESAVDFEFKLFSIIRAVGDHWSTVWFCHGIVGLWRRERFEQMMALHPYLPFGEDNWLGTLNLFHSYRMGMEMRSFVRTFAPPTLLPALPFLSNQYQRLQGYGATCVWKQRAHRWFCNAPRRAQWRLMLMLLWNSGQWHRNLAFALVSLGHIVRIGTIMFVLPLELFAIVYHKSWRLIVFWQCAAYSLTFVENVLVNWFILRNMPSKRVSVRTILLQPAYNIFLLVAFVYGHWRSVLYYIPCFPMNYRGKATVKEDELIVDPAGGYGTRGDGDGDGDDTQVDLEYAKQRFGSPKSFYQGTKVKVVGFKENARRKKPEGDCEKGEKDEDDSARAEEGALVPGPKATGKREKRRGSIAVHWSSWRVPRKGSRNKKRGEA